jgi:hypothetical protein
VDDRRLAVKFAPGGTCKVADAGVTGTPATSW